MRELGRHDRPERCRGRRSGSSPSRARRASSASAGGWSSSTTGGFVGIDASLPNRLVAEALARGGIPRLAGYARVRPEVRYGEASRVDFVLSGEGRPDAFLEVKNVHFQRQPGLAEFPDAATARGARHLRELAAMASAGERAVMLYVVQRADCTALRLAADRDPIYAAASSAARAAGVEVLAHAVRIGPTGIWLDRELPFEG